MKITDVISVEDYMTQKNDHESNVLYEVKMVVKDGRFVKNHSWRPKPKPDNDDRGFDLVD